MNVLAEALKAENIHRALRLIQGALGIKDGGVQDWTISQLQESEWQKMDRDARCACLSNYLKVEVYYGTVEEEE